MSLLVVGNACIDGIIDASVGIDIEENRLRLGYDHSSLEIVTDGPITPGSKTVSQINFLDRVGELPLTEQFGGGGYNSVSALRRETDESITYLDASAPTLEIEGSSVSLASALSSQDIDSYFLGSRDLPFNLVIGDRDDKIIVKSQIASQSLRDWHRAVIADYAAASSGVLLNSVKDEEIADVIIDSTIPFVACLTKSLSPEYVKEKVIPSGSCQFNYDEFGFIMHGSVEGDEHERIDAGIEALGEIRDLNPRDNFYVTLGSNGVLFSDPSGIYHAQLKHQDKERVSEAVARNNSSTTGAGDAFAAGVFKYEMAGASALVTAVEASRTAIRFLGYEGDLGSAFRVEKLHYGGIK